MPGIIDLPGWIWRRLPPVAKVGLVVAVVALIAVGGGDRPGHPGVEERARAGRAAGAPARPRRSRGPHPARAAAALRDRPAATSGVAARRRLLDAAERVGARGRPRAGARPDSCAGRSGASTASRSPATVAGIGAEDSTELRFGRYACLAVTAEFSETRGHLGRAARPPLPRADRLRHRALRVLQDRRPPRRGTAQAAPRRDGAGRVRRRAVTEIQNRPFDEQDLTDDPLALFARWFEEAASRARSSRRRWRWPRPRRRERRRRAWS